MLRQDFCVKLWYLIKCALPLEYLNMVWGRSLINLTNSNASQSYVVSIILKQKIGFVPPSLQCPSHIPKRSEPCASSSGPLFPRMQKQSTSSARISVEAWPPFSLKLPILQPLELQRTFPQYRQHHRPYFHDRRMDPTHFRSRKYIQFPDHVASISYIFQ